jgi:hypothetical protein
MHQLHIRDDSHAFLINNQDRIDPERVQYEQKPPIKLDMKEMSDFYDKNAHLIQSKKICSGLENFRFIGWNAENENRVFIFFFI